MNFLFFIVHPSKFHVFRHTINTLLSKGHSVKVLITSKDVLEDLLKTEEWDYENIFPEGRKIKGIHPYLSAAINTIRTVYRLLKHVKQKKYDLFITDDLLLINGWYKKIPTIFLQDDDVTAVPESRLLLFFANHILTHENSNMGRNNHKKIPFYGYKELGYLHPNKFTPNIDVVKKFNPSLEPYFILRLVSLKATHDTGKKGLGDEDVDRLINILEKQGKVFITSERELPENLERYRISVPVNEISNALFFAKLLIADSQTMSAEAGVLGTPFIRFNDFVGKLSYLADLEDNYKLGYGVKTKDKELLFEKIEEVLTIKNIDEIWKAKKEKMLSEKIDLTDFMVWLFENYPESITTIEKNPNYYHKFK